MPHKCVVCGKIYGDKDPRVVRGCSDCGSRFFYYIKREKLKKLGPEDFPKLSKEEALEIEEDIRDVIGEEKPELPIVLDFETVIVPKPGKYLIDLTKLFKKRPIIYRIEEGKYIIDFSLLKAKS